MFPTLRRQLASGGSVLPKLSKATRPAVAAGIYSRYKPKKVWPPDFSRLSEKQKFRLERRYKRRIRLATARPLWDKWVRLAQLGSVTFVIVYSFLFMEWDTENQPFEGVRNKIWSALGVFSSSAQRYDRHRPDTSTPTADQK